MSFLPRVFIGSSSPGLEVAHRVARSMEAFAVPLVWDAPEVFGPTGGTYQDLVGLLPRVDAAILVMSADDQLSQRRGGAWAGPMPAPRDNVVFELGLLIGALGRERVVFLKPDQPRLVMPTDLEGVNWVPYPGEGDLEETAVRLKRWLTGQEYRKHTRPIVEWPNPRADSGELLWSSRGEARHSLLMLGNTMAQTQAAYQGDLARWLAGDRRRRMGLLFLNPTSPHAVGRDRAYLQLGTRESGLAAYRQALEKPVPGCVPLLYDGPYRYSLRGLDLAPYARSEASEAHVTHSTHERGIAGGYGLSLPYHRGAEAFESFASDALGLWKAAWANPPGHGVALATCWQPGTGPAAVEMETVLERGATEVMQQVGRAVDFHLYPASQWHFTLCSLKRTGVAWGGPCSLSALEGPEQLPAGFEEYLGWACEALREVFSAASVREIAPWLTHLKLLPTGHLIAFSAEEQGAFGRAMAEFLAASRDRVNELGLGEDCQPKHVDFWPHVSVGMAFQQDAALPEPLLSEGESVVRLSEPVGWRSSGFQVVHYAYRTFRRLVGAVTVPLQGAVVERDAMRIGLGIG